jgi:hypothetical protein
MSHIALKGKMTAETGNIIEGEHKWKSVVDRIVQCRNSCDLNQINASTIVFRSRWGPESLSCGFPIQPATNAEGICRAPPVIHTFVAKPSRTMSIFLGAVFQQKSRFTWRQSCSCFMILAVAPQITSFPYVNL